MSKLDGMDVGDTKTIRVRAVKVQADDSDWHGTGKIVIPTGFEILKAEAIIVSSDEGQFHITSQTQPGYIDVENNVSAEIKGALSDFADKSKDDDVSTKMKVLSAAFSLSKVVDATTHAEIKWKGHAEGHKWGADGHIHADIEYTILRAPTGKDFQKILLELAKLSINSTADEINPILDLFGKIIDYNSKNTA